MSTTRRLLLSLLLTALVACDGGEPADDVVLDEPDAAPAADAAPAPGPDATPDGPPAPPDAGPTDVPLTITIPTTGETFDIVYAPGKVHITRLPARLRLLVRAVTSGTNTGFLPGATPAEKCAVYDGPAAGVFLQYARLEWGVLSSRVEYAPGADDFEALVRDALVARSLPDGPFELSGPDLNGLSVSHQFLAGAVSPTVPSSDAAGAPSVAQASADAVNDLVFRLVISPEPTVTMRIGAVCDLYNGHIRIDGRLLGDQPIVLEAAPQ